MVLLLLLHQSFSIFPPSPLLFVTNSVISLYRFSFVLACFTFIALTCLSFQVLRITTSKSDVLYVFSFEAISMYVIRNVNKLNLIRLLGRGGGANFAGGLPERREHRSHFMEGLEGGNLQRQSTWASPPRGLCTCTLKKVRSPLAPCMRKIGKLSDDMHHARKIQAFRIRLYLVCFWQRRER